MTTQNQENDINDAQQDQGSSPKKGSMKLVITLGLIVGAFYLLVNSMMAGGDAGGAYFMEVDEVYEAQQKAKISPQRKVRVKGIVKIGTYENQPGSSEHRFMVQGEQHEIPIYFKGAIPDVFKEGGEVVATGTFDANQVLTATEVTAKCPSKYEQNGTSESRKRLGLDEQPLKHPEEIDISKYKSQPTQPTQPTQPQ
jgi:cytochrome c-type biogenesis protein CcmE